MSVIKENIMIAVPTLASGGAERVAAIWADELTKFGNSVWLFTLYRVDNEYQIDSVVKRICLRDTQENYKELSFREKRKEIKKILQKNQIAVVIPMVTYMGILFNIARVGTRTKIIETIRNNPVKVPDSYMMKMARNISVKFSHGCIFQNGEQYNYFKKYKLKNINIISNPVSDIFLKSERHYQEIPHNIISLGRLHVQKNYKLLIKAVNNLKEEYDIKLDIYGDGSQCEELNQYILELKAEENIFIHSRTANVLEKMLEADIFVLSSDYEGMPNVLMEAMSTGIPCISTNCPTGPIDLINHGENGLLVSVNNVDELTEAIRVFFNDYSMAIKMGKKAKKDMKAFEKQKIVKALEEFIYKVLKD